MPLANQKKKKEKRSNDISKEEDNGLILEMQEAVLLITIHSPKIEDMKEEEEEDDHDTDKDKMKY
jgi:hypothetical protein